MTRTASIKYGRLSRLLCLLLALQVFNLSIDPPDPNPECVPEDLSINEIESVVEFILERLIGWEDAVAEHDDDDRGEGYVFDFHSVYFEKQHLLLADNSIYKELVVEFTDVDGQKVRSLYLEVNSPPPKA